MLAVPEADCRVEEQKDTSIGQLPLILGLESFFKDLLVELLLLYNCFSDLSFDEDTKQGPWC